MEQEIKAYKAAHSALIECELQIRNLWGEYVGLRSDQNDKKTVKARKKLLAKRSSAIVRAGNLSQKTNVAEVKMIAAILAS